VGQLDTQVCLLGRHKQDERNLSRARPGTHVVALVGGLLLLLLLLLLFLARLTVESGKPCGFTAKKEGNQGQRANPVLQATGVYM
jgi:hypothetical protein